ncbi:hypothetical protein [Novosphingobium sp. CECT 9465]|uniref:hypothetical protein n=1 Tax=Novosphingobium sp. CECT 9465 TaxID=2829794 RepID=UPI001E2F5B08|nr:hypothetical protein [Novosphingobium sp. CECT 9465]
MNEIVPLQFATWFVLNDSTSAESAKPAVKIAFASETARKCIPPGDLITSKRDAKSVY